MYLKQLEYIVAIAELESISRAAENFFISQSALSQQLSRLEKELNVTLFQRGRDGFKVTPAGMLYVQNAKRILAIRDETYAELAMYEQRQKKSILVGAAGGRSTDLFAEIYPFFKERFPDYELALKESPSTDAERYLDLGVLDFVFTVLAPGKEETRFGFAHEKLASEKLLLVTGRDHHLVPKGYHANSVLDCPPASLAQYKKECFILPATRTKLRRYIDTLLNETGIHLDVAYEVLSTKSICSYLSSGNLCTVISSGFLRNTSDFAFFALEQDNSIEYSICWGKNRRLSEADKFFIQLSHEKVQSMFSALI